MARIPLSPSTPIKINVRVVVFIIVFFGLVYHFGFVPDAPSAPAQTDAQTDAQIAAQKAYEQKFKDQQQAQQAQWEENAKAKAMMEIPEPRDCDYKTAPLGNKLCHYEFRKKSLFGKLLGFSDYGWDKVDEQ